jgi:hypothetical protein
MREIFQNFEDEITELFKAYRMAHFSLYNMEKTFYEFKSEHQQIETFTIKDNEIEVEFYEDEIGKNRENGNYQRIIAGNTLAMFYNIWEDKFRLEIANSVSLSKNEIRSDFFKELNYIRQSITHNSFNPSSKLDKLDKLSFMGNSTILKLSSFEVQKIKELLVSEIERLKCKYTT